MKRFTLPFLLVFTLFVLVVRGAETPVEAVLRIDAARLAAMMAGDSAALGRVFSDEIVFIHSDGRSENKADYIKNMTAGDTAYTHVKTSDVQARQIVADVIVLSGAQEMRKKLGSTWSELKLRFMSVWRNERGTWRMVAWQSLRPSGNSVIPGKK
jgi:ketosteroid isomerase-like protein